MVYNSDGGSRGNPRQSAYGFCLRDPQGNLIYAEANQIGISTNIEVEAVAMWKAISYCLSRGICRLQLRIDSLLLKHIVANDWKISLGGSRDCGRHLQMHDADGN